MEDENKTKSPQGPSINSVASKDMQKYLDNYLFHLFRRLKLAKLYFSPSQAYEHYFFQPAQPSIDNISPPDALDEIIQCAERIQLVSAKDEPDGKQEIRALLEREDIDFAIQGAYFQLFRNDLKILALATTIALVLAIPVVREVLVSTTVLTGLVFGIAFLGCLIMQHRQELKNELCLPEIQKVQSFSMP
jgi:hypothetical protein